MRTVVDAIVDQAGGAGTLTVLGAAGTATTTTPWRSVHDRARRMSAVLAGIGLRSGCRVGFLADTSVDLVAAIQATWLAGGSITVLAPPVRDAAQLLAVIADAGLDLVVVDGLLGPVGAALTAATRVLPLVALAQRAAVFPPAVPYRPDPVELAVLQYTSGSTRAPRGVPVTHGHLAANIAAIKAATDHDAAHPSRALSWLPLYHDMGLIGFLALPMSCGCPLVLQPPAAFARRPASWLEAVSCLGITATGAPNFAYGLMTRLLAAGLSVDLSSVRFMLSGAEPVDAAMMARFVAAARPRGLDPAAIVPAYGLAESTLAVTFPRPGTGIREDLVDPDALETEGRAAPAWPGRRARRLVRLGQPVPGTSLRIVDPDSGDPAGERRVGHIEVSGPSVVGHYWGDPRPPGGTWWRTGDLGYLVDGELVVCGRDAELLFAAGRNVFPQDIEAAAAAVPGVRAGGVAAFGVPGEQGDRLVVAVESRGGDPATVRRQVIAAVLGEVGLRPSDVVPLPAGRLPRTSSGKLRRTEVRRRYLSGELVRHRHPEGNLL
ncbi:MAG TPA: AMP-binding protein [Pilimelia sp.]|nr:AMP-binding protein [Pilimelia sp.]